MNILLLMMGGSGTRFGAAIPKQYDGSWPSDLLLHNT